MLNSQIINPQSLVVIGGSNDIKKPGGKLLKNIIDGRYPHPLYVVNPKESVVQGLPCLTSIDHLPEVELAILVIPAQYCLKAVQDLIKFKNTKAFIIISAGFGEADLIGKKLESDIVNEVDKAGACLIGPNCIGVLNANYHGVFTTPIPELHDNGCDLISASGATAVFIMEAGIPLGIKFSNVFSVGNAAQTSVEDVLEYMDLHFQPERDSTTKLLYLESISNPQKLLKHASSLIRKGAKIAAIKAGSSDAGTRAAASHTGAMASSDVTVRALFRKAGIVYCSSREELLTVASIFYYKPLTGKNIAIITHAGGSAVMLTDALSSRGLEVPVLEGPHTDQLLKHLYPGSSVRNPIDFLATGTAEQLGTIIDFCENKFDMIDAMVVVFGSPGLFDVENVYNVLSVKLEECSKPIYPVLPSVVNAQKEIQTFLSKGNVNFPDEVVLGRALSEVYKTRKPSDFEPDYADIDVQVIREVIDRNSDGFLPSKEVGILLDAAGIGRVPEISGSNYEVLKTQAAKLAFPLVMKVMGPVHKTDVGGVVLNVSTEAGFEHHFNKLMQIQGATGVLVQPMMKGIELFIGAKHDEGFGHLVLCGLGGIFIEVMKDVSSGLAPMAPDECKRMIKGLNGYKILEGVRGKEGVDVELFAKLVSKVSLLVSVAPEISEMDINPLLGNLTSITAVDTRILLKH
ncbi:MAG: acetate--CoA ligase family protein [Flavobacteriales bacterium]|nr:acetate--CoA ligase family protein [Flavobacteriales bacterium]